MLGGRAGYGPVYVIVYRMSASTTVRVRPETREAIARLSERRGLSAGDLLSELVAREEENELLGAMNEDFAALRRDASQWRALAREREVWERTLLDGLAGE
jgi:hypothetical protein